MPSLPAQAGTPVITTGSELAWAFQSLRLGVLGAPLARGMTAGNSFHFIFHPVPDPHHRGLVGVPAIDAIGLMRAIMILLRPFQHATAQALGVDLEVGERSRDVAGIGRPAFWSAASATRPPSQPSVIWLAGYLALPALAAAMMSRWAGAFSANRELAPMTKNFGSFRRGSSSSASRCAVAM